MKLYASRILLCSLLGCALATIGVAQGPRGRRATPPAGGPAPAAGVYTTVSGTISRFNYDPDAEVEGFLLSNNTLVHLPPRAAAHIVNSVHAGDNVKIAGVAQTSPAGVQTIEAQSVQDETSGKAFTVPQPGAAAPYSGSGRIQQLNYGPDGAVNGFVFDNGTLARVAPFAGSNPSSVRVGATVGYSGYARNTLSGRTVVDVQTLTINRQALSVGMAGPMARRSGLAAAPQAAPAGARPGAGTVAPGRPAQPEGRTDEPPPPPAPAQSPRL